MEAELDNPYIWISRQEISNIKNCCLSGETVQTGKPLLISAEDLDGEGIGNISVNKIRGSLKFAAVKRSRFGDRRKAMLEDIAILTGGTVISEERGFKLENAELSYLGQAEKVKLTR